MEPQVWLDHDFKGTHYELFGHDYVCYLEDVNKKVKKVTSANSWSMYDLPPSPIVYYFRKE